MRDRGPGDAGFALRIYERQSAEERRGSVAAACSRGEFLRASRPFATEPHDAIGPRERLDAARTSGEDVGRSERDDEGASRAPRLPADRQRGLHPRAHHGDQRKFGGERTRDRSRSRSLDRSCVPGSERRQSHDGGRDAADASDTFLRGRIPSRADSRPPARNAMRIRCHVHRAPIAEQRDVPQFLSPGYVGGDREGRDGADCALRVFDVHGDVCFASEYDVSRSSSDRSADATGALPVRGRHGRQRVHGEHAHSRYRPLRHPRPVLERHRHALHSDQERRRIQRGQVCSAMLVDRKFSLNLSDIAYGLTQERERAAAPASLFHVAGENVLGVPPLDPFVLYAQREFRPAGKIERIEVRPEELLRENLPAIFEDKWEDAYEYLFCDFFKTYEALTNERSREALTPYMEAMKENRDLLKSYGFNRPPLDEQSYAWATLLRIHVGHIFLEVTDSQTRLALFIQLFIDSHLQFVAFLRRFHSSDEQMSIEPDFYKTVPQYDRVMYQLPDLRPLLYKTDFFSYYPIPPNAPWRDLLHIFLTKATFHKCKIRNHESMTAAACIRNPALLHIIKLVMAQALMGYLGGAYRPRFATRLWLSQWLQIFAQMEIVQFRWVLMNRKKFMHMALREMSIYQVQHAKSIHAALQSCWEYDAYEAEVHDAMDTVRKKFDEQPFEDWLDSLPSELLPSSENPTPAEHKMSEMRVAEVRARLNQILELTESHLEFQRRQLMNVKLRKGSFAECCALMLRKFMRMKNPASMPDPRRRSGDPILSDEDLRKVHIVAAHAARRGDNFLEVPLLDLLGVAPEIQREFKNMYFNHEGFGESDNSLTGPLKKFMNTHPRDVAIVQRFCETVSRCQKRVLTSLSIDVMERQLNALRHSMNLTSGVPLPANTGDYYFCWCNEPLHVVVTPETPEKRAILTGSYRARYNIFTDQMFCDRSILPECNNPPMRFNLIGRVLHIGNKSYTLCVDCGALTTLDIDRWRRGPSCGRHKPGETIVYKQTGIHNELRKLDGMKELARVMRSEIAPPPNVAVTIRCEFCTEVTNRQVGRRRIYCFDDTLDSPDFRDLDVCASCFDVAMRRAHTAPHKMLYSKLHEVVVGWLTRSRDGKYLVWLIKQQAQGKEMENPDARHMINYRMPEGFKNK